MRLTERAIAEIANVIQNENLENQFLRISSNPFCLEFEDAEEGSPNDKVLQQGGVSVRIAQNDLNVLNDIEIDFFEAHNQRGFVFNSQKRCGTGTGTNGCGTCGCNKSFSCD